MKKFFYLVAIVATVALTACGGGKTEQKLSAEDEAALRTVVNYFEAKAHREGSYFGDGAYYNGMKLEGRDIVVAIIMDESELPDGITIKSAFQMAGMNTDAMADQMANEFNAEASAESKPYFEVLHRCNSTLIIRMEGSRSHETLEIRVPSEKLPK